MPAFVLACKAEEERMAALKFSLLLEFQAVHEDAPIDGLESRRLQEMLCYLLIHRHRSHLRESLITLLWADSKEAQARKYLRQTLWQLQAKLSPMSTLLNVEPEWIGIDAHADLWLDVAVIEQASVAVMGIPGEDLTDHQVRILTEAVNLYRGDLLEGWYQDWCVFERERLQNMFLMLLDKLMGHCEVHGRIDDGIEYGTRILAVDNARERTHRRLMKLRYLGGDRTGALRQFHLCRTTLAQELDVGPSRQTLKVYEDIQNDCLLAGPHLPDTSGHDVGSAYATVLMNLAHLQATLSKTQIELEQQISALRSSGHH
jgi:DNA-binding SARP family transcriptional activator